MIFTLASNSCLNPCFNGIYSARPMRGLLDIPSSYVLILVLMEYTQRGQMLTVEGYFKRLNPCFNGIYSASNCIQDSWPVQVSLNPCFNGIYSARIEQKYQALSEIES